MKERHGTGHKNSTKHNKSLTLETKVQDTPQNHMGELKMLTHKKTKWEADRPK